MWILHSGPWLSDGLCTAGLMVELDDLGGLVKLNDSMILWSNSTKLDLAFGVGSTTG